MRCFFVYMCSKLSSKIQKIQKQRDLPIIKYQSSQSTFKLLAEEMESTVLRNLYEVLPYEMTIFRWSRTCWDILFSNSAANLSLVNLQSGEPKISNLWNTVNKSSSQPQPVGNFEISGLKTDKKERVSVSPLEFLFQNIQALQFHCIFSHIFC